MTRPIRVAVTGAAGQIGYALLFPIASGEVFGKDQPLILQLLEIPPALGVLEGVKMELDDCAFELLSNIITTDDPNVAFRDADYAFLVGSKPRGPGMERSDLLKDNGGIFRIQGKALNEQASRDVRVLVIGNPANSNALIALKNAPDLGITQFSAMTRLDHNRAISQLALKTGKNIDDVKKFTLWGNHSPTMYPDISHAMIDGTPAVDLVDTSWVRDEFIPLVQQRGANVIKARGASSAASAAKAACDHMRNWVQGSPEGNWVSMAVLSAGAYGVAEDIVYSFAVTCVNGSYEVVEGLSIDDYSRDMMQKTEQELLAEREEVKDMF